MLRVSGAREHLVGHEHQAPQHDVKRDDVRRSEPAFPGEDRGPQARREQRDDGREVEEESRTTRAPVWPLHERDAEAHAEDRARPDADGARRPHRSHRGGAAEHLSRCADCSNGSYGSNHADGSSRIADGALDAAHDRLGCGRWSAGSPQGRRCGSSKLPEKLIDDETVLVVSGALFFRWPHVGTSTPQGKVERPKRRVGGIATWMPYSPERPYPRLRKRRQTVAAPRRVIRSQACLIASGFS